MRTSAALALIASALISQVSGTIYVTQPVASTVVTAGQQGTVAWNDDGNQPTLANIGACSIDLCTGGVTQQTCLQNISPSLDVSQNAQVTYTPNASLGPNGAVYFIKFTSIGFKDPTNPAFPFTAFSAKFTLAGMTGTFNATVSAEIDGSAVGPATTPVSTPGSTAGMATVTNKAASTASAAKTTTTAKAASGAFTTAVASLPGMALVAGLVMGAATLF